MLFWAKIHKIMPNRLFFFFLMGLWLSFSACSPQDQASAEASPPNILFAIADDASFPHMGAYGCGWVNTPGFDRVAREGLLFTRAYTPNAKCAPSRSCIITGRNPWQLEEAANHWPYFPNKFKTYAEALRENGYHVGFTAKGWGPGKVVELDGKPRELLGTRYSELKLEPPAEFISTIDYTANFEAFLNDRAEGEPFCFWYGATEPHRRYEYGAGIRKAGKSVADIDEVPAFWPDTDSVRTDLLDYAYEIEYFDQHLSAMLALLEERGELANTVVVVTADNGMPFPRVKGQEYEYSNHLPLAIMWPNGIKQPGRVIEDLVSFIDFAPTFLDIAGLPEAESGMQAITGQSLMDIFQSEKSGQVNPQRNQVLIGKERHDVGRPQDRGYPIRGIVQGDYLYLHNFEPDRWPAGNPETGYLNCDGSPTKTVVLNTRTREGEKHFWQMSFGKKTQEELYNIAEDPYCLNNLARDLSYQETRETLKAKLFEALNAQQDPRMAGNGDVFETYEYVDTRTQNFYERYMQGEELPAGWVNESDFEEEPLD